MFGAGLTRPLQANALHAATLLRATKHHPLVLAIDLPSGMHATTGKAITTKTHPAICVQATLTLALTALKPAMLTFAGQAACGVICIEKLPIPSAMHNRLMKQCGGYIAT
jgi:NAD(P)H-hydrate repair Nnr-like enzyme with NAD(P)H-hydrate epimerase domain